MSALEREMRSMTLQTSSTSKRSGSKTPKRSSSGVKSPKSAVTSDDEDELDTDLDFSKRLDDLLNDQLATQGYDNSSGDEDKASDRSNSMSSIPNSRSTSRLDSIMLLSDDEDSPSGDKIYGIADVITTLNLPRSQLNGASREVLLYELYKMIISKPIKNTMIANETDLLHLIDFVKTSRSHIEYITALKACVAYTLIDVDEIASIAIEKLFPLLLEKIIQQNNEDKGTNEGDTDDFRKRMMVESTSVISYVNLLLVIMDGSGCSGVEEFGELLVETAEGYLLSAPGSASGSEYVEELIVNCLNGVGVVLTLIYKNRSSTDSLNNFIQENIPRFLSFLELNVSANVQKSAARVIALCYELFDYHDDEEDDVQNEDEDEYDDDSIPYYDLNEITSSISALIKQSSKKVSKKDKKESRSVMREALNTIDNYATKQSRMEYNKQLRKGGSKTNSYEDGSESSIIVLSRIKLSKTRTFPITSWFSYFRIMTLKWVYGGSFQIHLFGTGSVDIKELIIKPERYLGSSYNRYRSDELSFDPEEDAGAAFDGAKKKVSGKAKTIKLNAARNAKTHQVLGDDEEDAI